jgi:ATP-dependent DNA helicase RecQ
MSSLLARLSTTPQDVARLPGADSRSLVRFLVQWEAFQDALDCLALLPVGDGVALQDLHVQALLGLGRVNEAMSAMEARLRKKDSVPARTLLARCYLQAGRIDQAIQMAEEIIATNPTSWQALALLGDCHLRRGDLDAAEALFLRYQQLSPNSRQPALGLTQVYHRSNDGVTASAYAVRAFTVQEGEYDLSIAQLKELRAFFSATGDENRLADANQRLIQRFDAEMEEARSALSADRQTPPKPKKTTTAPAKPAAPEPAPPPSAISDLNAIPVSAAEQTELERAVQRLFGFATLLPAQPQIIACARRGDHVLALLPTGGGKSLCYQLPAFLDGGVTLVISPLIALMKDQVESLPDALRQRTIAINSTLDGDDLRQALEGVAAGRYRLVYAAPERLRQRPFVEMLRRVGLARLVIDEAHCVSVWGHDFRPDYLNIAQAHRDLGSPPILALTATAPPRVRQDIQDQLFGRVTEGASISRMRVIAADTFRANLHLSAIKASDDDEKRTRLIALCKRLTGSGVVYARARDKCAELAAMLRSAGVDADFYHAGRPDRAVVQDRFMAGQVRIIVATVAFGMGVDKADIRFIIHYGLPNSLEAYYQEAGRAGRDGKIAHCILLYSSGDKASLTSFARQDRLDVETLRKVYKAVHQRLGAQAMGALALDDLLRDLRMEETAGRVALSMLEEAGLLQRRYDAPRALALRLLQMGRDDNLRAFAQRAGLRPGQNSDRNYLELCAAVGVSAADLEEWLLEWQAQGWLSYRPMGRDMLLALLPAPTNAAARVEALIERHAAIQEQRITELHDYARTRRCRHGHLAGYLGGQPRNRCAACDNCGVEPPNSDGVVVDEATQRGWVLVALTEQSWGMSNLIRVLRGEVTEDQRKLASPAFGKLGYRSEAALKKLIDRLIEEGLIDLVELAHGGAALRVTQQGQRWLSANRPR